MRELVLKKCLKCGAVVKIFKDCNCSNCGITCCDAKMVTVKPNSVDASFEKHIPNIEEKEKEIVVTINHVMDNDHYIEWVAFIGESREEFVYLKPNENAKLSFKKEKGNIYSYCNKHGLWVKEFEI